MAIIPGIETRSTRPISWPARFSLELRRDALLYFLIVAYTLFASILSAAYGRTYLLDEVVQYLSGAVELAACGLAIAVAGAVGWTLARERPSQPASRARQIIAGSATPRVAAGLTLYLALGAFMGAFTTVKTLLPELHPFWSDPVLAALDKALHFGRDPWRLLHPLLGDPLVTRAIELCYTPGWILLNSALPLLISTFCGDRILRTRYLLAFVLAWIVNGTVVAGVFMSGGPAFYAGLTGDAGRFGDLMRYLAFDGGLFSAIGQQRELWAAHLSKGPELGAGISAFPSLHLTMATLVALAGWALDRRLGAVLAGFALVVLAGSVHLGWHYAIDGYFGIFSAAAIWWAAGRWARLSLGDGRETRLAPGPAP